MSYENISVETFDGLARITLNRPKQLNAINSKLTRELLDASRELDRDESIGCLLITGNERAFAAGADVSEMSSRSQTEMAKDDYFGEWEEFPKLKTPKIAAVRGYALGGGCELAMMCDFIIAGESAKFGLPELTLGVIPGIGGTQRLAHLIGRGKAMELVLTARTIGAAEALASGLVARVLPDDEVMNAAAETARKIASFSAPSVRLAREAIGQVGEIPLSSGLLFERRVFHSLFATNDQKEGMAAFLEKRPAKFTNS